MQKCYLFDDSLSSIYYQPFLLLVKQISLFAHSVKTYVEDRLTPEDVKYSDTILRTLRLHLGENPFVMIYPDTIFD